MPFEDRCKLFLATLAIFYCCLWSGASGDKVLGTNYGALIANVRTLVSHPYRDNTRVMTGSQAESYVSLTPLAGATTSAELILSHRDLYVLGYRVRQNNQRVVYLFSDTNSNVLDRVEFDRQVTLNFGGHYRLLTGYIDKTRQTVQVTSKFLTEGIQLLEQVPDRATEKKRAETMLALIMIVSEAARFNEIQNSVQNALRTDATWRATDRHVGLMNSWDDLSNFITNSLQDTSATTSQRFTNLNEDLNVRQALALVAVILRCFSVTRRRRQPYPPPPPQCRITSAITAAIADGTNGAYFFNGANFAQVQFSPGPTKDRIVGGVKSIFNDWPFLRGTVFVKGLDAAFRVPGANTAYIFRTGFCAVIDVSAKRVINGPKTISEIWPSLKATVFAKGIDAAFPSTRKNEVYLFRGDQYVLVSYVPGATGDKIIGGPKTISSLWQSLRKISFVSEFAAAFSRPDKSEAYIFKLNQYAVFDYAPGTTKDRVLSGPKKITDGWTSLRNTCFDI